MDVWVVFAFAWLAGGILFLRNLLQGQDFLAGALRGMRATSGLEEIPTELRPLIAVGLSTTLLGYMISWPLAVAALWWARRSFHQNRVAGVELEAIEVPEAPVIEIPELDDTHCCGCGAELGDADVRTMHLPKRGGGHQELRIPRVRLSLEDNDAMISHQFCRRCAPAPSCECTPFELGRFPT